MTTREGKNARMLFVQRSLKLAKDRTMEAIDEIAAIQKEEALTDKERADLEQADTRLAEIHCQIGEVEEQFEVDDHA